MPLASRRARLGRCTTGEPVVIRNVAICNDAEDSAAEDNDAEDNGPDDNVPDDNVAEDKVAVNRVGMTAAAAIPDRTRTGRCTARDNSTASAAASNAPACAGWPVGSTVTCSTASDSSTAISA
jgi:hypothetical protein